jgi:hypothetical protein
VEFGIVEADPLRRQAAIILICGWMIMSKDGSQMKMAPHPAIAHGKANYVGDRQNSDLVHRRRFERGKPPRPLRDY